MDVMGNRLRRAFDLQPLPRTKRNAAAHRKKAQTMARRAASMDALGEWKPAQEAISDAMFGGLIGDHVDEHTGVNKFVLWCVEAIETTGQGLKTDGLYRVTVGQVGAKRISWQPESSMLRVLEREKHAHVLTAALKMFFKSLKQPIMRSEDFQIALKPHYNDVESAEVLRQVVDSLPPAERNTLGRLFQHLRRVVDTKENNMSLASLSVSFGPTLLRTRPEFTVQASMAREMKMQNHLVELLLRHSHIVFGPAQATTRVVTDYAGDDELDSSQTSDEDEPDSPMNKSVLVANVTNYKRNSSLSSNNNKTYREKIDSPESTDAKNNSVVKRRLLTSSIDYSKRNSSPLETMMKNKTDLSVSEEDKKKPVPEVSATNAKRYSTHSSMKEAAFQAKHLSSSSSEDEAVSAKKKHMLELNTKKYKKRLSSSAEDLEDASKNKLALNVSKAKNNNNKSALSGKKKTALETKKSSSSSAEDLEDASKKKLALNVSKAKYNNNSALSGKKKTALQTKKSSSSSSEDLVVPPENTLEFEAIMATYETNPTLPMDKKENVLHKPGSTSSNTALTKSPTHRPASKLSTAAYRESFENDDVFHDDESSSPTADIPLKEPIFNATPENYFSHSQLLDDDGMNEVNNDERELGTANKNKKASAAKAIMKKVQKKLFKFRIGKKKHKSSSSDDEKNTDLNKQLTLSEIDAMSVETHASGVPHQKLTTFKSAEETAEQQARVYEADGSTEDITMREHSVLVFSSDGKDISYNTNRLQKMHISETSNETMKELTHTTHIENTHFATNVKTAHNPMDSPRELPAAEKTVPSAQTETTPARVAPPPPPPPPTLNKQHDSSSSDESIQLPVRSRITADEKTSFSSITKSKPLVVPPPPPQPDTRDLPLPRDSMQIPVITGTRITGDKKITPSPTVKITPIVAPPPPPPPDTKRDKILSDTSKQLPVSRIITEDKTIIIDSSRDKTTPIRVPPPPPPEKKHDLSLFVDSKQLPVNRIASDKTLTDNTETIVAITAKDEVLKIEHVKSSNKTLDTVSGRGSRNSKELFMESLLTSDPRYDTLEKRKVEEKSALKNVKCIGNNNQMQKSTIQSGLNDASNNRQKRDPSSGTSSSSSDEENSITSNKVKLPASPLPDEQSANNKNFTVAGILPPRLTIKPTATTHTESTVATNEGETSNTKEDADHVTAPNVKPSVAHVPPDNIKPIPTLTEVFNSNTIRSRYYAPPLGSDKDSTDSKSNTERTVKYFRKASPSSSSSESFSDSSVEFVSRSPSTTTSSHSQSTGDGVKTASSVPTAL